MRPWLYKVLCINNPCKWWTAALTRAPDDAGLAASGDGDGEALEHQRQARPVSHLHIVELNLHEGQYLPESVHHLSTH